MLKRHEELNIEVEENGRKLHRELNKQDPDSLHLN